MKKPADADASVYAARTSLKLALVACGIMLFVAGMWNPFHSKHLSHPAGFVIGGIAIAALGVISLVARRNR